MINEIKELFTALADNNSQGPYYIALPNSKRAIEASNEWLQWLFINDLLTNKTVVTSAHTLKLK